MTLSFINQRVRNYSSALFLTVPVRRTGTFFTLQVQM